MLHQDWLDIRKVNKLTEPKRFTRPSTTTDPAITSSRQTPRSLAKKFEHCKIEIYFYKIYIL